MKYESPEKGKHQDDLYQMLAYCASLGLPAGLLIYAGPPQLASQRVSRAGIDLELDGIDLTLPPVKMLEGACRVARRFLRNAAGEQELA